MDAQIATRVTVRPDEPPFHRTPDARIYSVTSGSRILVQIGRADGSRLGFDGTGDHIAGLSFAARGTGVESWHKPFDLTEAEMKFSGIDLHSNNSVVVVSDA